MFIEIYNSSFDKEQNILTIVTWYCVSLVLLPLKTDTTAVKRGEIGNRQEEIRLLHRENLHGGGDYIC